MRTTAPTPPIGEAAFRTGGLKAGVRIKNGRGAPDQDFTRKEGHTLPFSNEREWRFHMQIRQTALMASLALAMAMGFALSTPAMANKQVQNTIGGAVVGAGVGFLVGGNNGAKGGAVVGAIAGARK